MCFAEVAVLFSLEWGADIITRYGLGGISSIDICNFTALQNTVFTNINHFQAGELLLETFGAVYLYHPIQALLAAENVETICGTSPHATILLQPNRTARSALS